MWELDVNVIVNVNKYSFGAIGHLSCFGRLLHYECNLVNNLPSLYISRNSAGAGLFNSDSMNPDWFLQCLGSFRSLNFSVPFTQSYTPSFFRFYTLRGEGERGNTRSSKAFLKSLRK